MKIALHLLKSLKHGGGETVALNYAKILNDLDVKSIFIGRTVSLEFRDMLIKHGNVQEQISKSDILKADYLFVHTNMNLLNLIRYLPLIRSHKKRVFYVQHLNYSERKFSILSKIINLVCTDFIQITPIISSNVKKYIKIKTSYLNNFYLNLEQEKDWNDVRRVKREELNIDSSAKIIMFSAVFKEGKGLKDMLDLVETTIESCKKEYVYLVVGDGPERHLIESFKYRNKVIWTGFVNRVEDYLIASDIYFFSSRFNLEMMPMALIEAINLDKKILSYKTDINDYLLNHETCNNLEEIMYCLENDIFPNNLLKYNYQYAFNKFSSIL
nr:glycosyltransferase [uncultured Flavobacterium sp.]